MKWFIQLNLLFVLLGFSSSAIAEPVPHTFTPGTTIKSSEMNANFDYLANRVSGLQAYDANGQFLGLMISDDEYFLPEYQLFYRITPYYDNNSIAVGLDLRDKITDIFYKSNDCTGDKYSGVRPPSHGKSYLLKTTFDSKFYKTNTLQEGLVIGSIEGTLPTTFSGGEVVISDGTILISDTCYTTDYFVDNPTPRALLGISEIVGDELPVSFPIELPLQFK